MTKCKACGCTFRKGTLAFILTAEGLKGARVCQSCVSRGVLIVPVLTAPIAKVEKSEAEVDATQVLRGLMRKLRTLAKLQEMGTALGASHIANGLEQAADIVEAWAKQPAARVTR